MNRKASLRRYGLALGAAIVAVLLLAVLVMAGNAGAVNGYPNGLADRVAGASANPLRRRHSGIAEPLRSAERTELARAHPLSANLLRRSQSGDRPSANPLSESVDSSPVMFIENVGQFDQRARFQVRGGLATMWLSENAIWITLLERPDKETRRPGGKETRGPEAEETLSLSPPRLVSPSPQHGVHLKLIFPGANPHPRLEPFDPLDTVVSYFIGNDPEKWRSAVPVWAGVRYVDLYPGVDLELTSEGGRLVQRLLAWPGADLSAVRLRVERAEAVELLPSPKVGRGLVCNGIVKLHSRKGENHESANVHRICSRRGPGPRHGVGRGCPGAPADRC